MKNYQAQTQQNLGLTKILQKFRKTSTPQENEHTPEIGELFATHIHFVLFHPPGRTLIFNWPVNGSLMVDFYFSHALVRKFRLNFKKNLKDNRCKTPWRLVRSEHSSCSV